ncbi:MAG: nucleotidyltransferase domain-containing protein [Candidatus Aenigmatarchaeota archaeon]
MDRLTRIIECIKKYNPEKIILFGSGAYGELDEYSDFDFVVIKNTDKRFLERLIEVAKLIDNDLGKVDVLVYTPDEFEDMVKAGNPFIKEVLEKGKIVYELKRENLQNETK